MIPAQTEVQGQARHHAPVVLHKQSRLQRRHVERQRSDRLKIIVVAGDHCGGAGNAGIGEMIYSYQVIADVVSQLVVRVLAILIAGNIGVEIVTRVGDVKAKFDKVRALRNREGVRALVTLFVWISSAIRDNTGVPRSKVQASVVAPVPNPQELMSAFRRQAQRGDRLARQRKVSGFQTRSRGCK